MFGDSGYGEAALSESVSPERTELFEDTLAFIFGNGPIEGSVYSFIHGTFRPQDSFYVACFMEGRDQVYNTEQGDWGTEAQANSELSTYGTTSVNNIYTPLKAYMNGLAMPTISDNTKAFIVMYAQIMDVPTEDGKDNEFASIAIDYGPHENHMRLYRQPMWVDRPTP